LVSIDNRIDLLALRLNRPNLLTLCADKPRDRQSERQEKNNHGESPLPDVTAKSAQVIAKPENARFQRFSASYRVEKVSVGLEAPAIGTLQSIQIGRFGNHSVDRKRLINKQIPDLLPTESRI
jgi:hypothetical protein